MKSFWWISLGATLLGGATMFACSDSDSEDESDRSSSPDGSSNLDGSSGPDSSSGPDGSGGSEGGTPNAPDDPSNLDMSGTTIPTTNYAIPDGAIFMSLSGNDSNPGTEAAPVRTLNVAIGKSPAGGTVVVRGGTDADPASYRDWYKYHNTTLDTDTFGVITKPITLQAYPGEKAWFDGTDVIPASNWTKQSDADRWSMAWSTPSFCGTLPTATESNYYKVSLERQRTDTNGPCAWRDASLDPDNPMALDPQMVFINGAYIKQVRTLAEVTASSFYYDWSARRIFIGVDPAGKTVELAARPMAMQINSEGSKVLGLGFRRYASHVYSNNPGVIYASRGQRYENVVFTKNAGHALMLSRPQKTVINRAIFVNNGGNGISGNGSRSDGQVDDVIIQNSLFKNNNTERFWTNCSLSCAAANIKLNNMIGFTIRNNIIEEGQGRALGAWCDIACTDGKYLNNVVRHNGGPGILDEISDRAIIASNLVHDNGGAGVRVASANAKIFNNTVVNNSPSGPGVTFVQGNVWIYDDPRSKDNLDTANTGATAVGPDTTNTQYANNVLVAAVKMNSYQGTRTDFTNTQPHQFFTLLDYNAYWRTGGADQSLVRWTDASGGVDYRSVSAFTAARPPLDQHSVDLTGKSDPFFVDAAASDYRLRSDHQAGIGTTIPSDVVQALGISSGDGWPKGAISWPGKK